MAGARVRAPELTGAGGWIGAPEGGLALADLRGKVVLLDFWTSCCVNCLRVTEELRELERRYAGVLVVLGIHSPKFAHERDHEVVRAAVARHRIAHPVLDDPGLVTWDAYAVRAWPTLVLVDAAGRVAWTAAGEAHVAELAAAIEQLVAEAEAAGQLRRGAVDGPHEVLGTGELAFPGKVASDGGARLAIADTGHDRILVTALDGEVLHELDGFYQPQGVCWEGPAALLVCETAADRVWRVALDGTRKLVTARLKSPWDVAIWHGHLALAEAGRHRLWVLDAAGEAQVVAGTGAENLVDGPALEALLAQPSGLAVTADGALAWVDSEASALRVLDRPGGQVRTLVGQGLFSWGATDGAADRAALQHPLGLAACPTGELWIADTFNGLLRVWRGRHLWTVPVEGFAEPGGLDVLPDGRLVVADTGNHRIVLVDASADPPRAEAIDVGRPGSLDVTGSSPSAVAETVIAEAGGTLEVVLDVPLEGDELDHAGGAPVEVTAVATDSDLLGGPASFALDALPARVELALGRGSGRITVELRAATCDEHVCRLRRTQRAYDVILTAP
ncbi:MAG: hypothetical protein QOH43_810 [Solirubrobacteraceae bacterium]|jgi:thiol-disulfide isomerase/thioredoxin/DNA-binding beta-propeller fold protein YncE|nr:hypothetical protein [Solirubrobacteraceae bacterium]